MHAVDEGQDVIDHNWQLLISGGRRKNKFLFLLCCGGSIFAPASEQMISERRRETVRVQVCSRQVGGGAEN